jgi:hypothetical protein
MPLISVGEKIALFEGRSKLPCVGRLVVVYQYHLLFFWRRKLVVVFAGCKQEWDTIRQVITQGIILEAVYSKCPAHLILLDFITHPTVGEEYIPWSS